MALPQGINFRSTLGYVTDGANEHFCAPTYGDYPTTTAQGNNVGWSSPPDFMTGVNRSTSIDVRLAGYHRCDSNGVSSFRIDLPSTGSHNVRIAMGDSLSYGVAVKCELFDNTSSLGVLSSGTTSAGARVKDATDTEYTVANWPGSNTAVTNSFSTTTLIFKTGDTGARGFVAHLYVESAGGATTFPMYAYAQQ